MKHKILFFISFILSSVFCMADDDFGYTKKPDVSSFNSQYPVESFGGTFDVSQLGAATYSVPIDVPVGVGGMQPKLSITYSSQSSFGLAGLGFNLSGLSSITRGPKTVWQDGVSSGMSLDSDCAFYLDGERLVSEGSGKYSLVSKRNVTASYISVRTEVSKEESSETVTIVDPSGRRTVYYAYMPCWKVVSEDDVTSTYECKLYSVVDGKVNAYSWVLTSVEDRFGNKIIVDYLVDKQNWYAYPKTISYGNSYCRNTVNFIYDNLGEEQHRFAVGDKIGCLNRRISSIVCKTGNSNYCSYSFSYKKGDYSDVGTSVSMLISLSKKNTKGESSKPIAFTWGNEPYAFSLNSELIQKENLDLYKFDKFVSLIGNRKFLSADINGDGFSDIIEIDAVSKKENNSAMYYTYLIVYASKKNNDGSISYSRRYEPFVMEPTYDIEQKSAGYYEKMLKSYSISIADFNNDGIQDLFIPYYGANKYGSYINGYFLYGAKEMSEMTCLISDYIDLQHAAEFKGTNLGDMAMNLFLPTPQKYDLAQSPLYAAFDIDNDGIGNYLILESEKTEDYGYKCYIGTPNDHGTFDKYVCFLKIKNAPKSLFASDYNKDGMIDIMVVYDGGYSIFYNKGKDHVFFSQSASVEGNSIINHDYIREGDFDGDGLADYFYIDGKTWYVAYGNGGGKFESHMVYNHTDGLGAVYDQSVTERDNGKFAVLVYDADCDGKSDIFVSKAQYKEHSSWISGSWGDHPTTHTFLFRSNGNRGENGFKHDYHLRKGEFGEDYASYWVVGDFNGSGRNSLMHYSDTENVWFSEISMSPNSFVLHSFVADTDVRKIKRISDAMDNTIEVKYGHLTDRSVYEKGEQVEFPIMEMVIPMEVVSSVKKSNGKLSANNIEYHYKGLKYHSQGRGILGFEEMCSENKELRTKTVSRTDSYDSRFFTPAKVAEETFAWSSKDGKYKMYNSNCVEYATDAVGDRGNYFHHPVHKTLTDLYGNKSQVEYVYDVENYVLLSEKAYSEDEDKASMYKLMLYDYPAEKNYSGALKPDVVWTAQKHSDSNMECFVRTKFEYDPNGLLVKQIENYGTDKALTTVMEYDNVGNVIVTTVSGPDIKAKTVYTVYDNSNRFVELTYTDYAETPNTAQLYKYDMWGHCTYMAKFDDIAIDNFEYDEYDDEEDIDGAYETARYEYDGWGNLVRSIDTFGNVKTVSEGWGESQDKKYYILTQGTHTPWVKTWYDSMGREVETESVGAKDISIKTATNYDNNGNVVLRESTVGERKTSETIMYDDYNRVVRTESSSGEVTTTSYDNRKITVSNGKKTIVKEFDSWGNPMVVDDGECEITYKYHSNGNPSEVKSDGDVTKFEYDEIGNKISMKTSDRGTITYKYNSLGECVYTKDGSVVHQNNKYDEQGRVIEEKSGSYTIKYVYGGTGMYPNKLTSKTLYDASGKLQSVSTYGYDEYGRVSREDRMGSSKNGFRTEYEYNENGEVGKVSYWISKEDVTVSVNYLYDCYGNKTEITCGGNTVWKLKKNSGKEICLELGGNGLESKSLFDDAGRLSSRSVLWRGGAVNSLTYSYDSSTGNMKSRTGMLNKTETFDYDSSDRLTLYRSLDGRPQTVDYFGNGNICEKTDLGTYRYEYSSKPHCLTQLDNEEGACSLDTREISYYDNWRTVKQISDKESGYVMRFEYDEDGNRNWSKLTKNGTLVREIEYSGNIEHVKTNKEDEYFVYLGNNLLYHYNCHISECLYLCTDHLGSVIKIMDDYAGVQFSAKYDAWGNQEVEKNDLGFIRGYVGQEELPEFELINMNARLYDPMLGRFLSPDNFVQMPENSQNFNRYAYCVNNPLKYSDPSGNFIQLPLVAIAAWQAGMMSWANGDSFVDGAWKGAAISVVSQGLSSGVGGIFGHTTGSLLNESFRAGAHGLTQGALSAIEGGDFWTGFEAGVISSIAGSAVSATYNDPSAIIAVTTVTGGLATLISDNSGNSFFQGAMIGFSIGTLNHCGDDDEDLIKKIIQSPTSRDVNRSHVSKDKVLRNKLIAAIEKDGVLSFSEAIFWYQYGDGSQIHVDASKLKLKNLKTSNYKEGVKGVYNCFSKGNDMDEALVYGKIGVIKVSNNSFKIMDDTYDFNIEYDNLFTFRNFATIGADIIHGQGTPFKIEFKGLWKK